MVHAAQRRLRCLIKKQASRGERTSTYFAGGAEVPMSGMLAARRKAVQNGHKDAVGLIKFGVPATTAGVSAAAASADL
jgi:hypothetical protein